jgi:hypothetical protein
MSHRDGRARGFMSDTRALRRIFGPKRKREREAEREVA